MNYHNSSQTALTRQLILAFSIVSLSICFSVTCTFHLKISRKLVSRLRNALHKINNNILAGFLVIDCRTPLNSILKSFSIIGYDIEHDANKLK